MIEKWEGEQARNLNNMPQTEREKEAWRNLGRPVTLQGVKLKMDGRKAREGRRGIGAGGGRRRGNTVSIYSNK